MRKTDTEAALAAEAKAAAAVEQAAAAARQAADTYLLRDIAARWMKSRVGQGKAASTLARNRDLLRLHIMPSFGDRNMRSISIPELDDFIQTFVEGGQTSQARSLRTALIGIFAYAQLKGILKLNPARATDYVRPKPSQPKAFTERRLEDIRQALDEYEHPKTWRRGPRPSTPLSLIFNVMLGAGGLRLGEALALRWMDLDLDTETPTVSVRGTTVEVRNAERPDGRGLHRQDHPKTASSQREVAIPEWLRQMLASAPRHPTSELVFATRSGRPFSRSNIYRGLRQALGLADVEHFVTHTVRKTTATAIDRKQGLQAASSASGHSNTIITQKAYIERATRTADVRLTLNDFEPKAF